MDATREYLLGRILLERRVVVEDDLRRLLVERDDAIRRGGRLTLVQLLVRDRKIDPTAYVAIQNEIELRGRACFACRRAYLVPPNGPSACPQCGGPALLPALSPTAPPPPSGDYSPSGRFAPRSPTPSGRVVAASNGSSGRGNYFSQGSPASSAKLAPSFSTSPGAISPNVASTDPGSNAGAPQKAGPELKSLGSYELLAELGRGGMGVVYKARHRERGDVVALKVLLSGEFASPKMLVRFKEEAATVQRLDHPNIVPVHEVGEIDGTHYFTMKFVEGDLLSALLKGRGLSARKGAELLRDVAQGVHHAHQEGVVHRDIKPANIIVERETGVPYLMDFGLAKSLDDDKHLSKTGVALGTPYYMPPEQAQGKHREIDPRSDVYALGAILYEILAKRVPFNAESQTSLLRKIVEEEPAKPSSFRQGVPEDLELIALKAIRKKKDERYPSAKAFATDIKNALAGREIRAEKEGFWKPLQRKLAKDPKLALIVGGCILLAAAAVAWGIHSANEAERVRQEQERQKAVEAEAAKKREADEEAAKRKAEAETWISKGHTKRFQARLASSWPSSRDMIDEAASSFDKALELVPEGSNARSEALYERALCALDRGGTRGGWAKALEDLAHVASSKTFPSRAHLALGFHYLRREHDPARARKELEAGRTPGREADDSKIREEEAASLVCRSYLASIDEDPTAAIAVARDAASRSDELGIAARSAELYARTLAVQGPSEANREAVAAVNRLVADDKWDYFVHADRAWFYSIALSPVQANESLAAANEIAPDAPDHKVVAAWLKVAQASSGRQALDDALATARADSPGSGAYWDALERRVSTVLEAVRRTARQFQENQHQQQPQHPVSHELYGDLEAHLENLPNDVPPKIDQMRSLLAQGRADEAIEVCKKIEQMLSPGTDLFFKLWRAKLLVESGRPGEGRPIVEAVLREHPDDALALTAKVSLECVDAKLDEANAACKKLLAANPRLRTPRVILATAYFVRRMFAEVPALLQPLWDNDPTDYEAGAMLADSLNRTGHQEDALGIAQKIVAADPKNLLARIAMSMSLRKLERYEEGARHLDSSLQVFPGHWFLLFERGLMLWPLKRWDDAEAAIKNAVAAAPEKEKTEIQRQFDDLKKKKPRS